MSSVMAIVSRKIFERDFRVDRVVAKLGDVVPTDAYVSAQRTLERLNDGGDLFLIAVAPGEALWLVGVLAAPTFRTDRWSAAPNTTPITDISSLLPKLTLENGAGITARPGALAMSLQTPRVLADDDVALIYRALGEARPAKPTSTAPAKSAKAATATAAKAASATKAASPATPPMGAKATATRSNGETPARTAALPSGSGLSRVIALVDANALAPALDELLRVWATTRASDLVSRIDALGAHIDRALEPIEAKPMKMNAAWLAVADQQRSIDIPRLTAAFEKAPNSRTLKSWLERLATFPRDPRIAVAALESIQHYVSSTAGPARTVAFRVAKQMGDRATCQPAIARAIRATSSAWNAEELRDKLRKVLDELVVSTALSPADAKLAAALDKRIAALAKGPPPDAAALDASAAPKNATTDQLLQAVLEDPSHDAPRLVYADHLQEQGDPRGELITLQLLPDPTPAQQKRISQLLRDPVQVASWLGPLNAIVKQPVFRRGFLHACHVELVTDAQRKLIEHPWFATVEEITCEDAVVLTSPAMKSLKRLAGARAESLAAFMVNTPKQRPIAITSLRGIRAGNYETWERQRYGRPESSLPAWQQLVTVGPFKHVRDLGMTLEMDDGADPRHLAWFFGSPLARQLESLELCVEQPRVARWMDVFATHPQLKTLAFRTMYSYTSSAIAIERAVDGFTVAIDICDSNIATAAYEAIFEGFPLANAPRIRLGYSGKAAKSRSKARTQATETLRAWFETIVDADGTIIASG